jgi:hypothetical protein
MTPAARRRWGVALLLAAWAGALAWLVFQEAFPGLLQQAPAGYRDLLARDVLMLDQWMTITFQDKPIGYTHTSVEVNDRDPLRHYQISNKTLITLNVMGARRRIAVNGDATVNALFSLQTFDFTLSSSGYTLTVAGRRVQGSEFDVTLRGAGSLQRLRIAIPDDAVLYSPMTGLTLKSLAPGKQLVIRAFNPITLATQPVVVRALRREPLAHRGATIDTLVLAMTMDGLESLSWLDPEGNVLRQQTPLGWTFEASDGADALAAGSAELGGEVLAALAVPVRGPVHLLESERAVRVRLRGCTLPPESLASHRQVVHSVTNGTVELTLFADRLPAAGRDDAGGAPAPADSLAPWLAATPFIQVGDRRISAKAAEIAAPGGSRLDVALALYDWVHRNVTKTPTVSLPSASDVLRTLKGDCNEHTYLFVALARASGIPAGIRIGLTLNEGRFYYHAWPSVYLGRWLDMDPTLGRPAVGAGYISLLEGELQEQMKLMSVIGRMDVEVLGHDTP